jgi:TldD protein
MLHRSIIDKVIPILKKDLRRAMRMHVRGFPKPYYASFLLRDNNWFNTWASAGSTFRKRSDRSRHVYSDVRVGSYRYDQSTEGGLNETDEERESESYSNVPIDDRDYDGLRMALWRLSEAKFREALSEYNQKESNRISKIDPNSKLPSFTKLKKIVSIKYPRFEFVDEEKWVKFCKSASIWMSKLPHISSSWVDFDLTQETKIFVNTEGSVIVQHHQIFSLTATLRKLTKEGALIERDLIINTCTQSEMPDIREFKKLVLQKYQQLLKLIKAKTIHAFSGPVLLYPLCAGLLFHEAIGHRLEGSRLLSSGEGQTFKGQTDKSVLEVPLNIHDNPRLQKFKGTRCVGAFDYDDEGVPSKDTLLIEDGVLKNFLNTRAALSGKNFVLNGHARNKKVQRPISRMGVTIVEGKNGHTLEELKELLLAEIRDQEKPFGMIVHESAGGETETTKYDFQAFLGEITFATLVYANGKEECVRGVNFVGTPLQSLNNIIAFGRDPQIENHYCGAESGMIPVTTISPAILLKNLELQAKDEELQTPYILPRPKMEK